MEEVIEENFFGSQKDLKEFSFVWRINNIGFFLRTLKFKAASSPTFSAGKTKLCLELNEITLYGKICRRLVLKCLELSSGELLIDCKINEIQNNPKKIVPDLSSTNKGKEYLKQITFSPDCSSKELIREITLSEDYPYSGDLIIICKGHYLEISENQKYESPMCYLENKLAENFGNQEFYDVTFSVSGKEFHAHKFILAARSSFFQKMFENDTKENILFINDVSPEVFEEILRFIYTGNVFLEKIPNELLEGANNFGLERLKAICAKHLCTKLSIENVCDLLLVMDKCKERNLKTKLINFINLNAEEIMKTDGWKLIKSSSDLMGHIFNAFSSEHAFWKGISWVVKNESPNFIIDTYFANSDIFVTKFNYKWTIKNFNSVSIKRIPICSPGFCSNQLYLELQFFDDTVHHKLQDRWPSVLITEYEIIFVNHGNNNKKHIFQSSKSSTLSSLHLKRDFLLDESNGFISDDTITIICEGGFIVLNGNHTIKSEMISTKFEVPDYDLESDLAIFLKNHKFSDVTLDVSGKEFHVHKLLLSARSPVFQAMFEHDMEESRLNKVKITDINPEVFEEMVNYIYSGSVSNINQIVTELYCAADKYALEGLKLICVQNLSDNLSLDSITEILIFGETFNLKELKASGITFITKNLDQVKETSSWKSMLETHPSLVAEICEAMVKK